jgi:hypothetical protein
VVERERCKNWQAELKLPKVQCQDDILDEVQISPQFRFTAQIWVWQTHLSQYSMRSTHAADAIGPEIAAPVGTTAYVHGTNVFSCCRGRSRRRQDSFCSLPLKSAVAVPRVVVALLVPVLGLVPAAAQVPVFLAAFPVEARPSPTASGSLGAALVASRPTAVSP